MSLCFFKTAMRLFNCLSSAFCCIGGGIVAAMELIDCSHGGSTGLAGNGGGPILSWSTLAFLPLPFAPVGVSAAFLVAFFDGRLLDEVRLLGDAVH